MDNRISDEELRILWNEVVEFKSNFTEDEFVIWCDKPGVLGIEDFTPNQYIVKEGYLALAYYITSDRDENNKSGKYANFDEFYTDVNADADDLSWLGKFEDCDEFYADVNADADDLSWLGKFEDFDRPSNEEELRILWNEFPKFKSNFTEEEFVNWGDTPGALILTFGEDYFGWYKMGTPFQYMKENGVCDLEDYFK